MFQFLTACYRFVLAGCKPLQFSKCATELYQTLRKSVILRWNLNVLAVPQVSSPSMEGQEESLDDISSPRASPQNKSPRSRACRPLGLGFLLIYIKSASAKNFIIDLVKQFDSSSVSILVLIAELYSS